MFQTNAIGYSGSLFNVACGGATNPSKREEVMDVVNDVLAWYHGTTPINTVQALFLSATNPLIHLDGVYFLLRRQPEVLLKMMSHSETVPITTTFKQDRKQRRSKCYRGCIVHSSHKYCYTKCLHLIIFVVFVSFSSFSNICNPTFLLFFFMILY